MIYAGMQGDSEREECGQTQADIELGIHEEEMIRGSNKVGQRLTHAHMRLDKQSISSFILECRQLPSTNNIPTMPVKPPSHFLEHHRCLQTKIIEIMALNDSYHIQADGLTLTPSRRLTMT